MVLGRHLLFGHLHPYGGIRAEGPDLFSDFRTWFLADEVSGHSCGTQPPALPMYLYLSSYLGLSWEVV